MGGWTDGWMDRWMDGRYDLLIMAWYVARSGSVACTVFACRPQKRKPGIFPSVNLRKQMAVTRQAKVRVSLGGDRSPNGGNTASQETQRVNRATETIGLTDGM